jgi:hypothetical protein
VFTTEVAVEVVAVKELQQLPMQAAAVEVVAVQYQVQAAQAAVVPTIMESLDQVVQLVQVALVEYMILAVADHWAQLAQAEQDQIQVQAEPQDTI